MPSNLLKLSSSSMESEFLHNGFERSGSFDSQGSHRSRSRSSTLDDENLKYLTNEEKNALMFLEETLDAFEEDIEESPVPHNSSLGYYSARSTEDSQSDNEDIIDLVQSENNCAGNSLGSAPVVTSIEQNHIHRDGVSETTANSSTMPPVVIPIDTAHQDEGTVYCEPPTDHPKLLGAIPTPVIIAQQISEKKPNNGPLPLILPKDEKSPELKKSVATSPISDSDFAFPTSPVAKFSHFPNNISIKRAGKEYNKTIAKAAVNVPERRAKVLANLHVPGSPEEVDGKTRESVTRRPSFRDVAPEQARYIALTKLGLINEAQIQADLHTASVSTSPVSNGPRSPTFAFSESQKRHSNEQAKNNSQQPIKAFPPDNSQQPVKAFPPEGNKKISHEQHFVNSNQAPKDFTPESSKRLSNEHYFNGPWSPKHMSPESNKKNQQEQQFVSGSQSPKIFPTTSSTKVSHEPKVINGQQFATFLPPEPLKKMADEQHLSQPPKMFPTTSSTKVSHEPKVINGQQSATFWPPEPLKKMADEQHSFSKPSAKYFPLETKSRPSKERDIGSPYSTRSLPRESNKTLFNEQENISRVLMSAPSSFIPLGKTVVIKGETSTSSDKSKAPDSIHISQEEKPNTRQEIKRTYSVPRPAGFRPQGITVQFSGRNSSEEDRKTALRKLGLLKDEYRP